MAFQKIGIMSIGEMGFHWAKLLKSHGVEVLTYDKDRGEVSRKRAENAGVTSVRVDERPGAGSRTDRLHRRAVGG